MSNMYQNDIHINLIPKICCFFNAHLFRFHVSYFLFLALHIHISAAMNSALQDLKWGFMMMERGIIDVKVYIDKYQHVILELLHVCYTVPDSYFK